MRKGPVFLSVTSSANLAALDATNKKLRELGRTSKTTATGLGGFGKSLAKITSFSAVVALGAKALKEATDALKTTAMTDQLLKNTGLAASVTSKQINDLSMQISNLTGIDDEQVQAASNVILGFKGLVPAGKDANATLSNLTKVAVDLGVKLGKDPAASAKLLGKALADPTKAAGALYRAGVPLDKQLQDRVKALAKAGQLEEARALILQQVATSTNGLAAAVADPMQRLTTILNNLLETIGLPVLDALTPIISSLTPVVEMLSPVLQQLGFLIGTVVMALATGLKPVIPVITRMIIELTPTFIGLVNVITSLLPLIVTLTPILQALISVIGRYGPKAVQLFSQALRVLVITIQQWFNLLELLTRRGPLSRFHEFFVGASKAAQGVVVELDKLAKTDFAAMSADALKTVAIDYKGAAAALSSGAKLANNAAKNVGSAVGRSTSKGKPKTKPTAKTKAVVGDQSFTVAGSGGGLALSVTVNGSVIQERDIARTIRDELLQFARRQGAAVNLGV